MGLKKLKLSSLLIVTLTAACSNSDFAGSSGQVGATKKPPKNSETDGDKDKLVIDDSGRIGALDCSSDTQKSQTLNLNFAATTGTQCAWGVDGNLGIADNQTTRAVRVQSNTIDLTGKKICSLSLNSPNQTWKYDDFMFVTFNSYVLASGQFTKFDFLNMGMATAGDLIIYDKTKHVGKGPYDGSMNSRRSSICPNPGSCVTPISEVSGQFTIDVPDEWFKKLPDSEKSRQIHKLELWITGQKHMTDCQHTGINFTGTVKYVE